MPANVPHPSNVLRGHRGEVQALDFDASERFLVTGDSLGEVRVWDLQDMRPAAIRRMHPLSAGILSLRLFLSGGQQLLGTQGRDGTTLLWGYSSKMQLSEEPVRSIMRDCYSFCRFSVLAGEQLADQILTSQPTSQAASERPHGEQQNGKQQQEESEDAGQAEEFVAAVLAAADINGDNTATDSAASAAATTITGAAAAAEGAAGSDANAAGGGEGQVLHHHEDGTEQAEQAGGPEQAVDPEPVLTAAPPDINAAIWAIHPCSLASRQHPPALLAIPGGSERTVEVVCCSCGQQVGEYGEEAAGRKLGMVMSVQLYCPWQQQPVTAKKSHSEDAGPAAATATAATEATAEPAKSTESAAPSNATPPVDIAAPATTAAPSENGTGPASPAAPASIYLAAGYEDGSVAVWRVGAPPNAAPCMLRTLCRDPVMALAVDSAGAGGAAGSAEDQLVVFKLDHGTAAASAETGSSRSVAPAKEGKVAGRSKLSVRHSIEVPKKGVGDVAVRPDGRLVAAAGWDGRVRVYKYRSGRQLAVLKYHTSAVTGIRFAPRSMLLATAARDGTVALWPLFQPADR